MILPPVSLALPLFVAGFDTDNSHHAFTADELAVFTYSFY